MSAVTDRARLLGSIVETIKDYHSKPTVPHVDRWVSQFPADVQVSMLREMDHVLKRTYFSKVKITAFLTNLLKNQQLASADPCAHWKSVGFLDIQQRGNSQREMLAILGAALSEQCGFGLTACGKEATRFLYIDDASFSGGHVSADISKWIKESAPPKAHVDIVVIALHRYGQWDAGNKIAEAAKQSSKVVTIKWWWAIEVEDRKSQINQTEVLRPVGLPDVEAVRQYAGSFKYPVVYRQAGHVGVNGLFSGEQGRGLLEQQLLIAGVHIRSVCPNLNVYQRPLGNMLFETLGFGSMFVTFRNCPNNAPLALWVGDPWYPLFPRTTNSQTESIRTIERLFKGFFK